MLSQRAQLLYTVLYTPCIITTPCRNKKLAILNSSKGKLFKWSSWQCNISPKKNSKKKKVSKEFGNRTIFEQCKFSVALALENTKTWFTKER
jgi:hypothetical protein